MATIINREVWHVSGVMTHGIVVKQDAMDLEANRVIVHRDNGFGTVPIHSSQVILTIDRAIEQAEEMADYWQQQVRQWTAERNRREDNAPEAALGKG